MILILNNYFDKANLLVKINYNINYYFAWRIISFLKLKFISKGVLLSTYIVVTGFISDVISGNKVFPIISC
jgi:hypothetical protein